MYLSLAALLHIYMKGSGITSIIVFSNQIAEYV